MAKCIIMCAGSFSSMDLRRQKDDFLIAADNGLSYLDQIGEKPDYVIGDYDSLAEQEKGKLAAFARLDPEKVTTLPVEKDDTDSLAAVKAGFLQGYRKFVLYGALGGRRLDHTLANLQTLLYIKAHGGSGYIVDESCLLFVVRKETCCFPKGFAGGFSVFSMDQCIGGVTIRGMKYNTQNLTISNTFPIGVSNHISTGQEASISVAEGNALVYLSWEDPESMQLLRRHFAI